MPFFVANDGTELFYKDWGTGRPVVFLHGWPLNADMWDYQMVPLVRAGLRTVAYDRRGFGRSDQPGEPFTYDTLADDLAALLEELDLSEVTLVGFSMGGGEVARYLSRHGTGRIARVMLVASVVPYLLKSADNPDGVDRAVFDDMVEGLEKDRPGFLAAFARTFYGVGLIHPSLSTEFLHWSGNLALQASALSTIDCVRLFSETDFRPDLAAFTVPTAIIHGSGDKTVPIDLTGRKAAAAVPGATFIAYDGAPHGLFYTERARLTADLLDFIDP